LYSCGESPIVRRGLLHQADDRVDRGRLAGAVWAEKPEKLAGAHAQRDAVDGGDVVVALDEIVDLDRVLRSPVAGA